MKKLFLFKSALGKISVLPSWVILLIDLFILVITSHTSYSFFKTIGVIFYDHYPLSLRFSILIGTNVFYFIVFKTYKGIIRYSTLNDIGRLFKAALASFSTIIVLDFINFYFNEKHFFEKALPSWHTKCILQHGSREIVNLFRIELE